MDRVLHNRQLEFLLFRLGGIRWSCMAFDALLGALGQGRQETKRMATIIHYCLPRDGGRHRSGFRPYYTYDAASMTHQAAMSINLTWEVIACGSAERYKFFTKLRKHLNTTTHLQHQPRPQLITITKGSSTSTLHLLPNMFPFLHHPHCPRMHRFGFPVRYPCLTLSCSHHQQP